MGWRTSWGLESRNPNAVALALILTALLLRKHMAWTRLNSSRAMRIKRFIRRPLIWLSTTLEQRMKTAALPHRWILASNSTSSSSVRLPWKASSSEVPLCCALLFLANPVVEPQATRGVILSMFSIILFALIRLPCAHALTYVWKTLGSVAGCPLLGKGLPESPFFSRFWTSPLSSLWSWGTFLYFEIFPTPVTGK